MTAWSSVQANALEQHSGYCIRAVFKSLTSMDSPESQRVQLMVEGSVVDKRTGGLERKCQALTPTLYGQQIIWIAYCMKKQHFYMEQRF